MFPRQRYLNQQKSEQLKNTRVSRFAALKSQRGSALVIAIFVIIVISLLGAGLVKILESSHENVAFEVIGTRAYTAAQTGVQWQLAQIFPLNSAVQECPVNPIPPNLSNANGLLGCEIILNANACEKYDYLGVSYYRLTSIGQCSIDGEMVSRTVEVEARSL